MLLRDLLAVPELRLRLLLGDEPALSRPVRWVYTTDLPDPARYLSGGELVITGLMWRRAPADSELFVAAIAKAGASALAAGEALGRIPADLVDACRRHAMALIAVPEEVSFAAVTEHVVGGLTTARGDRLAARLGRQRQLLSAVAAGMTLAELAAQVSDTVGLPCLVLTPTGRTVVPGPVELASADLDRLVHGYLAAARLPATTPGTPTYSVFPVGPALARLTSWFVAVAGDWSQWSDEVLDTVGELAAFAALDRARRDEGRRVAMRVAEGTVRLLDSGTAHGQEVAARLLAAGVDPERGVTAVVAGFAERPDLTESACALVEDVLDPFGPSVVGPGANGTAVALFAGPTGIAETLRTGLTRLAPALGPSRLVAGVSRPSGPEALSGALREARHALALAALRTGPVEVVSEAEVTSHVALLATVPDDVRRAFASRMLTPVLDYDVRNDAGLLVTLETFLDCAGSWSQVARRLHLHVNTVRYRISRVEELTGRDMARFEDRVDLFLALRSR